MSQNEYMQDILIDPDALDVEWLEQPRLMMKYAQAAADARKRMEEAKARLETLQAEMDRRIRSDPEAYGLAKITEGAVSATIMEQPEYQQANQAHLDARYESDMARYVVSAMDQRKDALENLVRLHGAQYFAGPSMPRDLNQAVQKRQEDRAAGQRVGTAMKEAYAHDGDA